jgi:hypothetical protein
MNITTTFTESEFEVLKRASLVVLYDERGRAGIDPDNIDMDTIKQIIIDGARDRACLIIQEDRRIHSSEKKGSLKLCRNCCHQKTELSKKLCQPCLKTTSRINYKRSSRKPTTEASHYFGSGRAGNRSDG